MNKLKITNKDNMLYNIEINNEKVNCSELQLNMSADSVPQLTIIEPITTIEIDDMLVDVKKQKQLTYPQLLVEIAKGNFKQGGIVRKENGYRYILSEYNFLELIDKDNNIIISDDDNDNKHDIPCYIDCEDTLTLAEMILTVERWCEYD